MTLAPQQLHGHRPMTGVEEIWERLGRVEQRVREAVAARRAVDPDPDDPYRGQYLTPEGAARILETRDAFTPVPAYEDGAVPDAPAGSRIGLLAERFGLAPLDVELLLVAMAPDIDTRFERLYGYLNDDLTRRRPTIGLALELCGLPAAGSGRFRFAPSAPLVAGGLLEIADGERPLLSRTLRVPDRVTAHLLGDDRTDGRLGGLVQEAAHPREPEERPEVPRIAAALGTGSGLVHLLDRGGDPRGLAVEALAAAGRRPLVVDVAALATAPEPAPLVRALATEARLGRAGVILGPLETLAPERPEGARVLGSLCAALGSTPLIAYGKKNWDPLWTAESPVPFTVGPPGPDGTARQWRRALADAGRTVGLSAAHASPDDALIESAAAYRLDSGQLRRAATVASRLAVLGQRPVTPEDLRTAVRAQNGAGLERLARRIEPAVGWDDLVLPPATRTQLSELALRARHRETVLGQWRMRPGGGRGEASSPCSPASPAPARPCPPR